MWCIELYCYLCKHGYIFTHEPFKYLDINLYRGRNKSVLYNHILKNIDAKLNAWSSKLLSPGGRLVLIQSVLGTLPLYSLAAVTFPKQTMQAIESKMAEFFWGKHDHRKKYHWLRWEKLCLPTAEGGLGIRSLKVRLSGLPTCTDNMTPQSNQRPRIQRFGAVLNWQYCTRCS